MLTQNFFFLLLLLFVFCFYKITFLRQRGKKGDVLSGRISFEHICEGQVLKCCAKWIKSTASI